MKRLLLTIAAIVVTLLVARPGWVRAQVTDPASVMDAFIAAIRDTERAIQVLADDVTIRVVPPPHGQTGVWTGKEGAGQFLAFTQAQNARRQLVGGWQVSGNTVSGTVMMTSNNLAALGLGAVEFRLEAVVENGKITSWTQMLAPHEQQRVAAAMQQPQTLPTTGEHISANASLWLLAVGGLVLLLGLALRYRRVRTL